MAGISGFGRKVSNQILFSLGLPAILSLFDTFTNLIESIFAVYFLHMVYALLFNQIDRALQKGRLEFVSGDSGLKQARTNSW